MSKVIGRREFLRGSAALTMASGGLLAAACSTASPQAAATHKPAAHPAGNIELFTRTEWQAQYTQIIQEFEAANPEIKVTLTTAPFATYSQRLLTLFASGSIPDAVEMVDVDFFVFASRGLFADLTPYVQSDANLNLEKPGYGQFYPSITEFFTSGKSIWAIPGSVNPFGIGFNVDMFTKAGVPTPYQQWKKGQWNWDTFVQTAHEMTRTIDGKKVYGYCDLANIWNIGMRVWQNGGEILNKAKTKFLVDEPAASEAIQWYFDLYLKHRVAPVSLRSPDAVGTARFASGEVAMFDGSPGSRAALKSATFQWGVAPQPKKKENSSWAGGFGYAIPKSSQNPDAAWEFLRYVSSKSGSETLIKNGALTGSAQIQAMNSPTFLQPPPQHVETFLGMLDTAQPQPFIAQNDKFLQIWNGQMDLASIGRITAKDAAAAVKRQATALLSAQG